MEAEKSKYGENLKPFLETVDQSDEETIDILEHKGKSKPYHAIMRIVLYIWPYDRRKRVTEELRILKVQREQDVSRLLASEEISRYTILVWKNLNVEYYYTYINRHKSYVTRCFWIFNEIIVNSVKPRLYQEGFLLEDYKPEVDPDYGQIAIHDDSKYTFVETVTYAMKWYPCKGMEDVCDEESWVTGLEHHYCNNEHHPEFWGSKPMDWRYIVESVYDMAAMELERRFEGNEPDNKALILEFNPRYLERFKTTGQLNFLQKLCQYTIEAYCKSTGQQIPPNSQSLMSKLETK